MPSDIYAVIASAARYWFLFLIVLIVWRSYAWLRKDGRARKNRIKRLPDAEYIGELVLVSGDPDAAGTTYPLPREGIIGSLRTCDVTLPLPDVAPRHAAFYYQNQVGLYVAPYYRAPLQVNGEPCLKRSKPLLMLHGSHMTVGKAELRLRFFVGIETLQHEAAFIPDDIAGDHGESDAAPDMDELWDDPALLNWDALSDYKDPFEEEPADEADTADEPPVPAEPQKPRLRLFRGGRQD